MKLDIKKHLEEIQTLSKKECFYHIDEIERFVFDTSSDLIGSQVYDEVELNESLWELIETINDDDKKTRTNQFRR